MSNLIKFKYTNKWCHIAPILCTCIYPKCKNEEKKPKKNAK